MSGSCVMQVVIFKVTDCAAKTPLIRAPTYGYLSDLAIIANCGFVSFFRDVLAS